MCVHPLFRRLGGLSDPQDSSEATEPTLVKGIILVTISRHSLYPFANKVQTHLGAISKRILTADQNGQQSVAPWPIRSVFCGLLETDAPGGSPSMPFPSADTSLHWLRETDGLFQNASVSLGQRPAVSCRRVPSVPLSVNRSPTLSASFSPKKARSSNNKTPFADHL